MVQFRGIALAPRCPRIERHQQASSHQYATYVNSTAPHQNDVLRV